MNLNSNVKTKILSFVICALSFGFLFGCQKQQLYKDSHIMMVTFVEVISPDRRASSIVFAEIRRIENLLSKYKPESEVSRLNQLGELSVSPDTFYVIKKSKEFWQASSGAFDITIGPLLDLWGFTGKNYTLPQEDKIKDALKLVGSDKIILNEDKNMVKFSVSGMKIDLGAIAKGYALDCAVKKLKDNGIKDCLINAGGQVFALGRNFGKPWKVAIRNPRTQGMGEILTLSDKCVSTSGDYEQYFTKADKRYSHIFNPKTGFPADSGLTSVTVIADSGLTADALSTAIFVLGKEKGEILAKKLGTVLILN